MALDASGQPVDLTSVGGAADGTFASQITVKHDGAMSPRDDAGLGIATKISQTVDRWGNVLTVTDPRNAVWVTTTRYNYLNQAVEQLQPVVNVWDEDGNPPAARAPVTRYFYDARGRQIATKDANDHVSVMSECL